MTNKQVSDEKSEGKLPHIRRTLVRHSYYYR